MKKREPEDVVLLTTEEEFKLLRKEEPVLYWSLVVSNVASAVLTSTMVGVIFVAIGVFLYKHI
jgi:hypothetical protein